MTFFAMIRIFTLLFLIPALLHAAEKRPNILWLAGENLSLDLGCYGMKNVRTDRKSVV